MKKVKKYFQLIDYQLPARGLFFALVVILMVALISGALVSLAHLQQNRFNLDKNRAEVIRNAHSGFEYLLGQTTENQVIKEHLDLFGVSNDSTIVKRQPWGFYDVLYAKAHRNTIQGTFTQTKSAILGAEIGEEQRAALYLQDNYKKLSLVGNTRIEGRAYLPRAGVSRGYISGLSYYGDQLIYGEQKRSKRLLPPLNKERIEFLKQAFLKTSGTATIEMETIQSFGDDVFEVYAPTVYIKDQSLKGQMIIRADSMIYVGREAKLEDVLLFAPSIVIESGFEGSLQAFATNTILIGEKVKLNYPSGLSLLLKNPEIKNQLVVQKETQLEGQILVHQLISGQYKSIKILIEENVNILGELYSDMKVDFRGKIAGNITCSGFVYRSPATIFDNHLLNAEISSRNLVDAYQSSFVIKKDTPKKIIKWLKE